MQREKQTPGGHCEGPRCTPLPLPSMALLWKSGILPLQTALTRHRTTTGNADTLSVYKLPFSQTTRFSFCPLSTRARQTILRRSGHLPRTRTCSKHCMKEGCRNWATVAADNAYGNGSAGGRILTPYSGSLTSVQDSFNYFLSSLRIMVEQTFGVLVARWVNIWSPLRCSLAKASEIIVVCGKVHNYITHQRDKAGITAEVRSVPAVDPDNRTQGQAQVFVHDALHLDLEASRHVRQGPCELRDSIANQLRDLGLKRPTGR
jgi:DDE superfamily endonuclease